MADRVAADFKYLPAQLLFQAQGFGVSQTLRGHTFREATLYLNPFPNTRQARKVRGKRRHRPLPADLRASGS